MPGPAAWKPPPIVAMQRPACGPVAMAWAEAMEAGKPLHEQPTMREIERYNEVDCGIMYEVIEFVRR